MKRASPFIIPTLLVMTCLPGLVSYAQQRHANNRPDQYKVVHWDKEEGLAINNGNTMIKDADGFLWIGSAGSGSSLYRFDGAVFKKYAPEENKKGVINSGGIHTFEEDSLHNIWIGTEKGLSRYDIKADTFSNFAPLYDSSYDKSTIAPFWATRDVVYCMEPGFWITAIDVRTFHRRKLVKIPKEVTVDVNHWNANKSFFEAASGSFWALASYEGRHEISLVQIFPDGNVANYPWPCYRNHSGHQHGHDAEDMEYDALRNSIWINSSDGLMEFSLRDKKFQQIAAMNEFIQRKDYDRGVGIDIDQKGRIWFSTWSDGILVYDSQTKLVEPLFSDPDQQKRTGEKNLHIHIDQDGTGWISNWGGKGIYELLPINSVFTRYFGKPLTKDSLSSAMVSTILRGTRGKLWLGTADGLNIFDPATQKFEVLREKDIPGVKGKSILPLFIDTVQQVAFLNAGSPQTSDQYFRMAMYEMDLKTRKCSPIVFNDGVKVIDSFVIAHALVIPYKDGIIFCDELHGVFELKKGRRVANLLIPFKHGFGGISLVENRYLFLQGGGSLPNFTFENKNEQWTKIPHLFDSLNWSYILYNSKDQTYWVCVSNEILHFNKDFQKLRSYSPEIWDMALITNLLFDNNGNLWFVNYASQIGRLNPITGVITAFWESDGYQKQDYGWFAPATKDAAGNIYFGIGWQPGDPDSNWGFDRSYPEKFFQVKASKVYLDALFINQMPFLLTLGVNSLKELSLRYNQNNISVETGIIDYYSRRKSQIRYKLVENGLNADWQYGPSGFTLHYEGLAPGNYKLVMQSSNVNNEFIGPEKILLITISSPFWEKAWFRIMALVFGIALLYGFIRYRSRNLRRKNELLEEKVISRTRELKHSLEELRDTQNQLIQREKMASLGELTAGIAHEIQNPLNFIKNFSEVSVEIVNDLKEEIKTGNYDEAMQIANDIEQNLQKVVHHGNRADSIVKGMLQHSRASTGKKEPTDINALAEEWLRVSYHGMKARNNDFAVRSETHFDDRLEKVNIVPEDIGRVLLNIYNNAFYSVFEKMKKMTGMQTGQRSLAKGTLEPTNENYEPTVIISTRSLPPTQNQEHGSIEIRIRDNGMGIPQKILDKIYQPFFTTKPTGEGTGLGLSLSYDIITKAHGGELSVVTREGEFAEFIIRLPVS